MRVYLLLTSVLCCPWCLVPCLCLTTYTSEAGSLTSIVVASAGHVFVGGSNVLVKLTEDLSRLQEASTLDGAQCRDPTTCSPPQVPGTNRVSILRMYTDEFIIWCGTLYNGSCVLYDIADLGMNGTVSVVSGTSQPAEAARLGSATSAYSVVVNVSYTACSSYSPCIYSAIDSDPMKRSTYSFSVRRLHIPTYSMTYARAETIYIEPKINNLEQTTFDFVYGFYSNHRVYFLRNTNNSVAYLSEMCIDDHDFRSYIESKLECEDYVIATAGYVPSTLVTIQRFLFVTFSSYKHPGSVLCVYDIARLRQQFREAKTSCFKDGIGERPPWIRGNGTSCDHQTDAYHVYDCGERRDNARILTNVPISNGTIFRDVEQIMTSVAVTVQDGNTVAFVGFESGKLIKLLLHPGFSSATKLLSLEADKNRSSEIRRNMAFNQNGTRLYFAYGNKVSVIETADCSLHNTCRGCLSAVSACTWCSDQTCHAQQLTSPCLQNGHVVQHNRTCPPRIIMISPTSGPLAGRTSLTLYGEFDESLQSSSRVTIGSHDCSVSFISSQRLICRTSRVVSPLSANVEVSITPNDNYQSGTVPIVGQASSTELYSFKEPSVTGFSPRVSRLSGNILLTITGRDLDIGSERMIAIGEGTCDILRINNGITCSVPPQNTTGRYPVAVHIDNAHLNTSDAMEYIPNPVVNSMFPRTVIIGGGVHVTLSGQYMDGVGSSINVSLVNVNGTVIDKNFGICEPVTSTSLSCLTVPVVTTDDLPMTAVIQFPGEATDNAGRLTIVEDPRIFTLNRSLPLDMQTPAVIVQGAGLLNVESSEVIITVGDHRCDIETFTNSSVTCRVKQFRDKSYGTSHSIVVRIGNRKHVIGNARFPPLTRPQPQVAPVDHFDGANIVFVVFGGILGLCIFVLVVGIGMRRLRLGPFRHGDDPYNVTFRNGSDVLTLEGLSENMTDNSQNRHNAYQDRTFVKGSAADVTECKETDPLLTMLDDNTRLALEREHLLIDKEWLVLGEVIGQGNFGCVYKGYLQRTEEKGETIVAVKTLHRNNPKDLDVHQFLKEALIMKNFHHMHVVELVGVCLGMDSLPFVVLPYMQNGDLLSYLRDETHVPTVKELVLFGVDIADGMHYLAELKFVHRDLAARNCMIDDNLRLKVADFGLSRDVYEKEYYSSCDKTTKLPVKWMSPESLEFGVYSSSSDVWSYGVVLWELLTRGMNPYPTVDNWDILKYLKSDRRMVQPNYCPEEMYDIMLRCWCWEKDGRPTFGQLSTEIPYMMRQLEQPAGERGKRINIETTCTYVNFMSE